MKDQKTQKRVPKSEKKTRQARRSSKAFEATAFHEAGHTVACVALGVGITRRGISIESDDDSLGRVHHKDIFQGIRLDVEWSDRVQLRMEKLIMVCLAGPLAQRRHSPRSFRRHHAAADNEKIGDMFLRFIPQDEQLVYYKLLEIRTKRLLCHRWNCVEAVASALLHERTLSPTRVKQIIRETVESSIAQRRTAKRRLKHS